MSKKRKNRLVVEMVTADAVTEKEAARLLQIILEDELNRPGTRIQRPGPVVPIRNLKVKQFTRVIQSIAAQDRGKIKIEVTLPSGEKKTLNI